MSQSKEKLTTKEFLGVLVWIFGVYFKISPSKTILMILTKAAADLNTVVYAFMFGKIVDQLIDMTKNGDTSLSLLYPYMIGLFLYYVFLEGMNRSIYRYCSRSLKIISKNELERFLYQHLNTLGIQNLEDPETINRIQRCQQWVQSTYELLEEVVVFISNAIKVIVTGATVISFFPLMLPVIIVLTIIKFFPDKHFLQADFHWQVDHSEERRKARASASMLGDPTDLQEISIVGAYEFLNKKFLDFFSWWNAGILRIYRQRETSNFLLTILDTIASLLGYGIIFNNLIQGQITIGTMTFQMKSLDSFSGSIERILSSISWMNEFAVKMTDFVVLFNMKPKVEDGSIKLPRLKIPPKIEFVNVSFKYPNSESFVFQNLSFKINSGEKVALVGHNGAGKTTIVKLLARIYIPTSGKILINGKNLNDLRIDDWYKNLGILFQDFNFYSHLTAKENIYLGKSMKALDEKKVIEAAKNADAHDFISAYTQQYDQILGEKYVGGIRPSTGQQQKIAIARFFYRDAPLAIFDEPTAAIDAVSEYKIFNRIYNFFKKKTVVIISHRFSTVRNADRIIVLEKGQIVEEGTHNDLLAKDSVYAHAYKLQAEGYQG